MAEVPVCSPGCGFAIPGTAEYLSGEGEARSSLYRPWAVVGQTSERRHRAAVMASVARPMRSMVMTRRPRMPKSWRPTSRRWGPTFVKLGQLLSTRSDLLPPVYLQALRRLQDKVEPVPFDDIERVVTAELGMRMSRAFSEFSATPAAAASLGQVHRAVLRDGRPSPSRYSGPDIRGRIVEDMEVIDELANFVDEHTKIGRRYGFAAMVEEFRVALMAELDYRAEARNLVVIGDNLAHYDRIVVPRTGPRLHHVARAHDGLDLGPQPRGARSAWASRARRTRPGRRFLSCVPRSDSARRLLPRRSASGQCAAHRRRTARDHRLGHGRGSRTGHPGALIKLLLAVSGGRGSDAANVMIGLGEQLTEFDAAAFRRRVDDLVGRTRPPRSATCKPAICSARCSKPRARQDCDRRVSSP